jgi:hypothetical protein
MATESAYANRVRGGRSAGITAAPAGRDLDAGIVGELTVVMAIGLPTGVAGPIRASDAAAGRSV